MRKSQSDTQVNVVNVNYNSKLLSRHLDVAKIRKVFGPEALSETPVLDSKINWNLIENRDREILRFATEEGVP